MKAPDKIFVPTRLRLVDGLRVRESDTDEEYIRKDALLEWAKNNSSHEQGFDDGGAEHGYRTALKDLIGKLNSM